ncbi:MAG: hypothetical protein WCT18_03625, partial [Patescibacteria group bacterium]
KNLYELIGEGALVSAQAFLAQLTLICLDLSITSGQHVFFIQDLGKEVQPLTVGVTGLGYPCIYVEKMSNEFLPFKAGTIVYTQA